MVVSGGGGGGVWLRYENRIPRFAREQEFNGNRGATRAQTMSQTAVYASIFALTTVRRYLL